MIASLQDIIVPSVCQKKDPSNRMNRQSYYRVLDNKNDKWEGDRNLM